MVEEEKAKELTERLGKLSETDYARINEVIGLVSVGCECTGGGAGSGKGGGGNCKCPHGAGA